MSSYPGLWVIAGPNGAGKSTFVQRYKLSRAFHIVNPDEIVAKIASETGVNDLATQIRAGRLASEERMQLLRAGETFGIETTLSGHAELNLMKQAKRNGYKVNLIFISVSSPSQSNSRVGERVKKGGHNVPESDIYRRFERITQNLTNAILIADRVQIVDNSYDRHYLAFKIKNGVCKQLAETPYWVEQSIQDAIFQMQNIHISDQYGYSSEDYFQSPSP